MTLDLFGPLEVAAPSAVSVDSSTLWQCALLDPPWLERGGGKYKRGADRHYDVATTKDIKDVIVASGDWTPAEHAHCWMWVTDSFLKDGLWLMEELGFTYKRTYQWVKVRADKPSALDFETGCGFDGELATNADGTPAVKIGIGQYARGAHEMMLFGVRGKGQHPSVWSGARDVPSVLFAPHERDENNQIIHSRKPRASYDLVERVSVGERIEFFARVARPGWRLFGNQAPQEVA
jgi:N6-adenosine-specific RNA methylase IME4